MVKIRFSQYRNSDVEALIYSLSKDYYDTILHQCINAENILSELQQTDIHLSTTLYISLSSKLLAQVKDFLTVRTGILVPYIIELNAKSNDGHDCENCSGNCSMRHASQLIELKESHKHIKEILYRLQMVAMPLYSEEAYPNAYRILRNEMMLIDTSLTELFYIEEATLIPKIMEAQKKIHAHD